MIFIQQCSLFVPVTISAHVPEIDNVCIIIFVFVLYQMNVFDIGYLIGDVFIFILVYTYVKGRNN